MNKEAKEEFDLIEDACKTMMEDSKDFKQAYEFIVGGISIFASEEKASFCKSVSTILTHSYMDVRTECCFTNDFFIFQSQMLEAIRLTSIKVQNSYEEKLRRNG